MNMQRIYRVIDSNLNRVSEGLRVLEDIARFVIEDSEITSELRSTRHRIRKLLAAIDEKLISARDSVSDIGREISGKSRIDSKKDLKQLLVSNFKRVEEGLRSIEESMKIPDHYQQSKKVENIRFEIYDLEKRFFTGFNKPLLPRGIYGITAEKYSNGKSNVEVVQEMIEGGVSIIQYREKHKNKNFIEMYKQCLKIRELTAQNDVLFIVNDYIELALMVEADGVHIGQNDYPVEAVKKVLPEDKIIGLSTHSPEQARRAEKLGVDYIGVGPIFSTNTKEAVCDAVGLEYLEWVAQNSDLPYVAIGGIKKDNIQKVIARGARTIALVTEIVAADDIAKKVKNLKNLI